MITISERQKWYSTLHPGEKRKELLKKGRMRNVQGGYTNRKRVKLNMIDIPLYTDLP